MRRTSLALAVLLATAVALPASAHPERALDPTLPTDVTHARTDNVEYLGRFPEHWGTAGGRLLGDRFYLTDPRGVYVYDVSTPEAPELLGSLVLPQSSTGAALAQEDPDTDGEILLVDAVDPGSGSTATRLQVVDVSDPANLSVLGSVGVTDHTWTCVSAAVRGRDNGGAAGPRDGKGQPDDRPRTGRRINECAFAYGRSGNIVDLRDPTQPEHLGTSWRSQVDRGLDEPEHGDFGNTPYTHDLTEIRPGRVVSAGAHNVLMDTSNPAAPVLLADHHVEFHTFGYHSIEWANDGKDPILVAGTEIAPDGATNLAGSDCQGEGSWITTYDVTSVLDAEEKLEAGAARRTAFADAEFVELDNFHVDGRGVKLDGNAPAHTLFCAHWMELAPSFDGGGKMAVAYYDWGVRFVDVASDGTMEEFGWFVPFEGYTGSVQWITDEIVYVMDYRRGMEVLRLTDEPTTTVVTSGADAVAAGSAITPASQAADGSGPPARALAAALGGVLLALGLRRRRRAGVATT
jgi:hypothetical protein